MATRSVSVLPVRDCQTASSAGHHCRRCSDPAAPMPQMGQGLKGLGPHTAPSLPRRAAHAAALSRAVHAGLALPSATMSS
eukprot:11226473-Lingulodinium_polyedra.AAC.1